MTLKRLAAPVRVNIMPDTSKTEFIHLNDGWNAEPNAPSPRIAQVGQAIVLEFYANCQRFKDFREEEVLALEFVGCRRYRLGPTNDEGWYRGQCRFSKVAPKWGEFYEVRGDFKLEECPKDWKEVNLGIGRKHYLFYLRDETFECDADGFEFKRRV